MACKRRTGWSLLELIVVVAILGVLAALTLGGVQRVRHAAARTTCADRLRQLGIALQNYHAAHGRLPPGLSVEGGKSDTPFLSWQARLLPHLEQDALWQAAVEAFRQDPDFLSRPHTARSVPVAAFLCPSDARVGEARVVGRGRVPCAFTSYLGVVGTNAGVADGLLYMDSRHRLADATDGASNTLLVGERPPNSDFSFGWWYAGWGQAQNGDAEMVLGVRSRCYTGRYSTCPEGPYSFTAGKFDDPCAAFHFWSPHPSGAHFLFADGSVRFLAYSADPVMPALATRAGGEVAALPD